LLAGLGSVKANIISYGLYDQGANYAIVWGSVQQFDPAMGQLTDVTLELFSGNVVCNYLVVNNTPLDTPFNISVSASADLYVGSPGILGVSGSQVQSFSGVAPANSVLQGIGSIISVSGSADTSLAANLDYFTGTGFVAFYGDGACNLVSSDPSSLNYVPLYPTGYLWDAYAQIIYTYNEPSVVVPEPTTMIAGALLLLPFGASTLRILRKNRTA
jgi:hypothetical protein